MAEARRLARLIEMPDLRLIARHNPFAGMFDRGPDVEEGDDHTRTLSQRIDSETMNFQVILNALEECAPLLAAPGVEPRHRIGCFPVGILPFHIVCRLIQDRRDVAPAKCDLNVLYCFHITL